jgi:hypothetical protein
MIEYRSFRAPHVLTDELNRFLRSQAGNDFKTLSSFFPTTTEPRTVEPRTPLRQAQGRLSSGEQRPWKLVVMGGLLRDLFLDRTLNVEAKPADMDIVIFGASSTDNIREKLGKTNQTTNSFGGIKCRLRPRGIIFDLWRVEDHANMATARKPHTIEQLLKHNLLDIDALAWDPAADTLHNYGALEALAAGRIGLVGRRGKSAKFAAAQIAHVLTAGYKTNFPLSDQARAFVVEASRKCEPSEVEAILSRKMPHAAVQIETFWKDILAGGVLECPTPMRAVIPQPARARRSSSSLNIRH